MQGYIINLFHLAVLLIIGLSITAITRRLMISNILFLVLAGSALHLFKLNFFDAELLYVLAALTLVLIVLEATLEFDVRHIVKNFFNVFKCTLIHFFISMYIMTLLIFLFLDIPGSGFEVFVLSLLLSLILYGSDPPIVMEFLQKSKGKIKELLEIEGVISGAVMVIFSLYLITYLSAPAADISRDNFAHGIFFQIILFAKNIFIAVSISVLAAWLLHKFLVHYDMGSELEFLAIFSGGIISFVVPELLGGNGSLTAALFGLFLHGFHQKYLLKKYTTLFAHTLYIIVFIIFGAQSQFPPLLLWIKGLLVFVVYLLVRLGCLIVFLRGVTLSEKLVMSLNVAKGIDVALILFLIPLKLAHLRGAGIVVSLGFMFFVYSYIVSTAVNRFWYSRQFSKLA